MELCRGRPCPVGANRGQRGGLRGAQDGWVYALDAASGALQWSYATGSTVVGVSPVVANGVLYVTSADNKVYAFEPQPAEATIQPTPGVTTTLAVSGSHVIMVPNDAGGDIPLRVQVQRTSTPTWMPGSMMVFRALQVSFTNLNDGAPVKDLRRDVTIEMSYVGLGLTMDQIGGLFVYNASENEYLPTAVDRTRQVAIAKARRFSLFALAQVIGPVPRAYVPLAIKALSAGW